MFKSEFRDRRCSEFTDQDLLLFVWKWKVVSMAMLIFNFSRNASESGVYRKVRNLMKAGHLQYVFLETLNGFGVSLTKSGFSKVQKNIDYLEKVAFRSEAPLHDYISAAIHFGLFEIHKSFFHSLITEHEIQNLALSNLPVSAPKTRVHCPDGYLIAGVNPASGVIAIEIELSAKEESRYTQLAEFYSKYSNLFGIWIAKTRTIAINIEDALKSNSVLNGKRHLIYEWENLVKNDWNAQSTFGAAIGTRLSEIVQSNYLKNSSESEPRLTLSMLLSTKKSPYQSNAFKSPQNLSSVSLADPQKIPAPTDIVPDIQNVAPLSLFSPSKQTPEEKKPNE